MKNYIKKLEEETRQNLNNVWHVMNEITDICETHVRDNTKPKPVCRPRLAPAGERWH